MQISSSSWSDKPQRWLAKETIHHMQIQIFDTTIYIPSIPKATCLDCGYGGAFLDINMFMKATDRCWYTCVTDDVRHQSHTGLPTRIAKVTSLDMAIACPKVWTEKKRLRSSRILVRRNWPWWAACQKTRHFRIQILFRCWNTEMRRTYSISREIFSTCEWIHLACWWRWQNGRMR